MLNHIREIGEKAQAQSALLHQELEDLQEQLLSVAEQIRATTAREYYAATLVRKCQNLLDDIAQGIEYETLILSYDTLRGDLQRLLDNGTAASGGAGSRFYHGCARSDIGVLFFVVAQSSSYRYGTTSEEWRIVLGNHRRPLR